MALQFIKHLDTENYKSFITEKSDIRNQIFIESEKLWINAKPEFIKFLKVLGCFFNM